MENQDIKTEEQTAQTTELGNGHTNPIETYAERLRAYFKSEGLSEDLADSVAGEQYWLEEQHNSLMDVVAGAPIFEGEFVLRRLEKGKVHGGTFGNGGRECSCLLGTMATAHNLVTKTHTYDGGEYLGYELADKLDINHRPAQSLFGGIYPGETPVNNPKARVAHQYITELLMSNRAALGREERAALRKLQRAVGRDIVPRDAE